MKIMRNLLCCAVLVMPFPLAWAGDAPSSSSPASPPPRELLGQIVNIDRNDFKAKGKVALHRLQPLAGQLTLSEARGDPDWILKTISPWNPALARILGEMKIQEVTLADADLLLDGSKIVLKLARAAIPEGRVEQVDYQQGDGGVWRVETGALNLDRLPAGLNPGLLPLSAGAVGFARLEAAGDREKGRGWANGVFAQGWRIARVEGEGEVTSRDSQGRPLKGVFTWNTSGTYAPGLQGAAKRVPELAEMLRFAGRDPFSRESVDLGKLSMRVESDGQGRFLIQNVRVEAPWVRLRGEGILETQGKEEAQRLRLDLVARTPAGKEKRFKINLPLRTLVKP
ncbi:MAG: hypothetical protein HQL98_12850 [Magnetococcales bacterium]|nr:hypothetical protein [Magnetococcales bacterium]